MKIVICEDELVYQVAIRQAIKHWQDASGLDCYKASRHEKQPPS